MFFILSKLLSFFLKPMIWIMGCLLAALIVRKQRKRLLLIGIGAFLFFTNPFLISVVYKWWEIAPMRYDQLDKKWAYGVVLTGIVDMGALPDDRIHFNASVDRINHAIELFKRKKINQIIISGGSGSLIDQELKEAPMLAQYAIMMGVPKRAILVESESRNTHENARYTQKLLQSKNKQGSQVLLITSAFHMRRSAACFEKAGISFIPFSTDTFWRPSRINLSSLLIPSLQALDRWHIIVREWFGMLAYKLVGYI